MTYYKLKPLTTPQEQLEYSNFLNTIKVLKMLFGRQIAENFFTNNMHLFYDIDSESIANK